MIILFSSAVLIFILYIFWKTINYSSKQINYQEEKREFSISKNVLDHLSEVIQFKTITYESDKPEDFYPSEYQQLHQYLEKTFPLVHQNLQREKINNLSLLYKWKGKDETKKPVIIIAHQDVVPIERNNLDQWQEHPFSGALSEDKIWGRGSIDMKSTLVAIYEAIEILLEEGFSPERNIYLAFGHDEETGGSQGAGSIARVLKERGIHAEFILDEGLVVTRGLVPAISKDVALIGIAEKGNLSLELSVNLEGGHSSMPAEETAIDVMASAVSKIKRKPFKARICQPVDAFFKQIGPEMPFSKRIAFANQWCFKRMILNNYKQKRAGNALVRTTTSPTIFKSGHKDNVIPYTAKALVNFRILPGNNSDSVIKRTAGYINDNRIKIKKVSGYYEPSKTSSTKARGYHVISRTINEIFPGSLIAPGLMIAGTDSKHYREIADNIYRFSPFIADGEKLKKIHGVNENISQEGFKKMISFYYNFIANLSH